MMVGPSAQSHGPQGPQPPAPRRAGGWPALALLSAGLTACYSYAPLHDPEPQLGQQFAFELAEPCPPPIADGVGPETARVQGTLVRRTDTDFVVSVSQAVTTRGRTYRWNGEMVTLPQAYVRQVRARRFSASRTVLVAGGTALSFVALVVTRSLGVLGGGSGDEGKETGTKTGGDIQ